MISGIRDGFFHPFAEPAKHSLAINAFAAVKAINAFQQLHFQFLNCFRRAGQALLVAGAVAAAAGDGRSVDLSENVGHRMDRARGRRGGEALANDVGFGDAAGLRLLLDLARQNIRQPDGQRFHAGTIRQKRWMWRTKVYEPGEDG
jgi:hypothetical protein